MSHEELFDLFWSLAETITMLDSHRNFADNYFSMTTRQELATYNQ